MSHNGRLTTLGLLLSVLGIGIGVGLVIASFVIGVGTEEGSFLSSVGGGVLSVSVLLTVGLSLFARRRTSRDA